MEFRHKPFVIFLDVDGVLNTRTTVEMSPNGYTGVDDARIKILADTIELLGGADIVLSSDWKELRESSEDYKYLVSKLEKQGLVITAKTNDSMLRRGLGILNYLSEHKEIEEYVILDDNKFDFYDNDKNWDRWIKTRGIEKSEIMSTTPAVETIIFIDILREAIDIN